MAMSSLQQNRKRSIKTPLQDRNPTDLDSDISNFHTRHDLGKVVSLEVLKRGARIARDSHNATQQVVPEITRSEQVVLEKEKTSGFGQQTKELKVTILTVACAAFVQGWQQSTVMSSGTGWAKEFEISDDTLLFGLINAAPPSFGSLIGTWLGNLLQGHVYDRRPALFISATFSFCAVLGSAFTHNWQEFLVYRALLGIVCFKFEAKASIATLYAAEVAADQLRGSLIMSWQLFEAFGTFLGFATGLAFFGEWRLITASATIPTIPLLSLIFLCPKSPRFLIRKSRYKEAYLSLRHLRETEVQAARDLYTIHCQLQTEIEMFQERPATKHYDYDSSQSTVKSRNYWQRITKLMRSPRNRRACVSACLVMVFQQLCGMNILAFFSSGFFAQTGSNEQRADWLSLGWGLAIFSFIFTAYKRIDFQGQRLLMPISLSGMIGSLSVVDYYYQIGPLSKESSTQISIVLSFCMIFLSFYLIGEGSVPFTLSAEVFPLTSREAGMKFSVLINFLGLGLLVLVIPSFTKALGHRASTSPAKYNHGASDNTTIDAPHPHGENSLLLIFVGLNALAFILVFLFVPSTGNQRFKEMNYNSGPSTLQHVWLNLRENIRDFVKFRPRSHIPRYNQYLNALKEFKITRKSLAFCSAVGLREDDVPPGHQRIRWTNGRGKTVYDDFIEHKPGAIQARKDLLDTSAYRSRSKTDANQEAHGAMNEPSAVSNHLQGSSTGADRPNIVHNKNTAPPASVQSGGKAISQDSELGHPALLHLLSCTEKGRYRINLHYEHVAHIADDQQLFRTIRQSYHERRGKFRALWCLRTVYRIDLVKLGYGGSHYVDVRSHDDICVTGMPCECIPPAERVPPRGTEYECSPMPPELSPPIGWRQMMNDFSFPEDIAPGRDLVLRQLPKRTEGELECRFDLVPAWGIYFKEGWDWMKIWWCLAVGFFLPSLLFGILWGSLKRDIQGAFGLAGWWMTGATIVIGFIGTRSRTI